jgi:hypothetical protein
MMALRALKRTGTKRFLME